MCMFYVCGMKTLKCIKIISDIKFQYWNRWFNKSLCKLKTQWTLQHSNAAQYATPRHIFLMAVLITTLVPKPRYSYTFAVSNKSSDSPILNRNLPIIQNFKHSELIFWISKKAEYVTSLKLSYIRYKLLIYNSAQIKSIGISNYQIYTCFPIK